MLRGVRQSLNRYLSILCIVALGAGFLAGLFAVAPDMFENADEYMDDYRWYDVDVKSAQGLTDEDIAAIRALDCVEIAQPACTADLVVTDEDGGEHTVRVYALLGENGETELNRLCLKEGRLPENAGECAIQSAAGRYAADAPQPGDVLTIADGGAMGGYAAQTALTVVGVVESPMCISVESEPTTEGSGSISLHAYVTADFFDADFYTDCYVAVCGAAEENTFEEGYRELVDAAVSDMEALGEMRAPLRADALRAQIQEQLASAQAYLDLIEDTSALRSALNGDAAVRAAQGEAVSALLNDSEFAQRVSQTAEAVSEALAQEPDESERADALRTQIEEANAAIAALGSGSWIVRTRSDSVGYANYKDNVDKVSALCRVFPMFFFLVALLVALTTMTRLVEERRRQNGALKAMGFTDGQILGEYLLYSLSSSVLGCTLGFCAGFKLLPTVVSGAYGMMYMLPKMKTPLRLEVMLAVAPATVGGILLATLWACLASCRACPAQLMQPQAPAPGKRILLERIGFVWRRMPFVHKVACRNLFRYKKRLCMTIVGMAGCSALMLTGFGLRDSIKDIVHKQFGEIYLYDLSIVLDEPSAPETDGELAAFLSDKTSGFLPFYTERGRALGASESAEVDIAVAPREFDGYIELRERKTGKALALWQGEVVLTEKLCELLGLQQGDEVTLEGANGVQAKFIVGGVTENYVSAFAYLTEEDYRTAFGEEPTYTTLLCTVRDGADMQAIAARAMRCEHVLYASAVSTLMKSFDDSVKSIDAIVWVLILAAGMLSMVVNYSLTNVNICERRRELSTLRVLGFHDREVERYIFRETNALSLLGSLLGLPLGVWLHAFVVKTVELNSLMFGRTIKAPSYLFALAIAVLFTLLINRVMRRSICKIDMLESMKASD